MSLTESSICDLDWEASDFSLLGVDNKIYSLSSIAGSNATLVMFICNHCPYVLAIIERLVDDINQLQKNGIGVIAIMPNATELVPKDSFDHMKAFSKEKTFSFPYVIDETQTVAKTYNAICTPDFFGFNSELKLQYRGRLDEAGKNPPTPNTKKELLHAMMAIAETGKGPTLQTPSIGCSIKWRE